MKVIITGPPRCGKSTLVSKLIDYYRNHNYTIYGFLTPEVRDKGMRIGFDFEDISSGVKTKLARIGNYQNGYKLGKYRIFIQEFDKMLSNLIFKSEGENTLFFIDEIGKMELFSKKFQVIIKELIKAPTPLIATIGLKLKHPIKKYILNHSGVLLINLNRQNQKEVLQKIISLI